jgi:hypothetical protein
LAVVDEQGKEKSLPNQDSERFRLRAGERIAAVIVLKKAPLGAILGSAAGVAGVFLLLAVLTAIALAGAFDQEPVVERPPSAPPPTPSLPLLPHYVMLGFGERTTNSTAMERAAEVS